MGRLSSTSAIAKSATLHATAAQPPSRRCATNAIAKSNACVRCRAVDGPLSALSHAVRWPGCSGAHMRSKRIDAIERSYEIDTAPLSALRSLDMHVLRGLTGFDHEPEKVTLLHSMRCALERIARGLRRTVRASSIVRQHCCATRL
jgi:hypothetical protein